MTVAAKREELRRVDIGIDKNGIQIVGDIVETATECPIVAKRMKAFFQMQVQAEVCRETA